MENEKWKSDILNWTLISKETASLIINQSESLLKETIDTSKTITAKSEKLLSFQVPGGLATIVYFFNNYKVGDSFLLLTSILCFIVIFVSLCFSFKTFRKHIIYVTGEYPKNIATSKYIDCHLDEHQQYINLVLSICENTQNRIDANRLLSEKRSKSNEAALIVLVTVVLCPIAAQLILWLFPAMHF